MSHSASHGDCFRNRCASDDDSVEGYSDLMGGFSISAMFLQDG